MIFYRTRSITFIKTCVVEIKLIERTPKSLGVLWSHFVTSLKHGFLGRFLDLRLFRQYNWIEFFKNPIRAGLHEILSVGLV